MTPLVSVIIPTYNRAPELQRALASVVGQTWTNWEALVIDNHSTDNTKEIVAGFHDQRMRLLSVDNHGVIGVSRNLGVRSAQGKFVAFLDSDDWWAPRKLAESVCRLDAGADVVYHDLFTVRSLRQRLHWHRHRTRALATPVFDDLLQSGNAICNSSAVVRREILLRVGGFSEDPSRIAWEDYDAWLRIARVTERFERLGETLGYYWTGGGNISSPQRLISILERFNEVYVTTDAGASIRTPPAWCHYLLGRAYYQLGNYSAVGPQLRRALAAGLPAAKYPRVLFTAVIAYLRLVGGSVRGSSAKSGVQ